MTWQNSFAPDLVLKVRKNISAFNSVCIKPLAMSKTTSPAASSASQSSLSPGSVLTGRGGGTGKI